MAESQACELPIIDISKPLSDSSLSSLYAACNKWGFFYITNHGISKDFFQKLIFLSNQVFCLPQETKLEVGISSYVPRFVASPFFESFKVPGPDFFASAQSLTKVLFNDQNTEFSNLLEEYGSKMTKLSKTIIELLLKSLGEGFQEKFYDSEFSNCHGYLRINNYSPPESIEEDEEVEGLGKHADISCMTILFQDDVGGLQMRSKEGKWMEIKPCEDALVVNIGDYMQAWSNEKLRSAEHRVVLKQKVKRISLAFFWSYGDDKEIYAPKDVVGEGNERLYRPFSSDEYRMFRGKSVKEGSNGRVGATVKDFAGI